MCGRFTLRTPAAVLIRQFMLTAELDAIGAVEPRYNIAPSQQVLAVRAVMDGKRAPVWLRWGLIPSWADDPKIGWKMSNARAETVHEKPSFRSAFKDRRCLVLADGYYEWKQLEGKNKQPYYFHRADDQPFAFAGLWEHWSKGDAGSIESCTLMTTAPNELTATVHDRMPVIIREQDYDAWLAPGTDATVLRSLLVPFANGVLVADPVSTYVNKPANQGPECIASVE